ncbi:hypothetical protein M2138_001692 [Dysgonomonadaceae bacterium PH5-43]|nr:hypothetical protein [Dysgonomonadaceae bacterium PH5-43]
MYKKLFILLYKLIVEPVSAWGNLEKEKDKNGEEFYKEYLFPIIGIIALLSFIGVLLSEKTFDVQLALKVVLKEVMIYGGGFYLASFLIKEFVFPRFEIKKDKVLSEKFVGYSSVVIYAIAMLGALFPSLFVLQLLSIYTIYVIWVGAVNYLKIEEDYWVRFTTITSIIIMITPFLLKWLISLLMPGMRT